MCCDSERLYTCMCWMKLMISVDIVLMILKQQINPKEHSVQLVMWPQIQHEMVKGLLTKFTKSPFSWWAAKGLAFELGSVTSLQLWSHTTTMAVEVSWSGEGSPRLGEQNSTYAKGMSLGSTTETMSLSPLLCPTPVGMGRHSSFMTTMQEPIVRVLSKITYGFAELRLCRGQRSTQASLRLNICGTSSGGVSWDGLTNYRTSTSSLMHSRRNGAGSTERLIRRMRRHCVACLAANGGPTHY